MAKQPPPRMVFGDSKRRPSVNDPWLGRETGHNKQETGHNKSGDRPQRSVRSKIELLAFLRRWRIGLVDRRC